MSRLNIHLADLLAVLLAGHLDGLLPVHLAGHIIGLLIVLLIVPLIGLLIGNLDRHLTSSHLDRHLTSSHLDRHLTSSHLNFDSIVASPVASTGTIEQVSGKHRFCPLELLHPTLPFRYPGKCSSSSCSRS